MRVNSEGTTELELQGGGKELDVPLAHRGNLIPIS
jgi:hypothetical protein